MAVVVVEVISLKTTEDVVKARQLVRGGSFSASNLMIEQTKLITAVNELAPNTVIHDGGV